MKANFSRTGLDRWRREIAAAGRKGATVAVFAAIWFAVGYLFYKHPLWASGLCPLGLWSAKLHEKRRAERREKELKVHFELFLRAMTTALQAGKSVENALKAAAVDIGPGATGGFPLWKELDRMNRMLSQSVGLERALDEFQRRLGVPEISEWVLVFRLCRKSGGDLVHVMRHTSSAIAEKLNLEREIAVTVAGKRFEALLLSVVPFVMIGCLTFGASDYMEPLYHGAGRLVMTAALGLLLAGMAAARRLMRIEL